MHVLIAVASFLAACVGLVVVGAAILVVIPILLLCWVITWLFGDREDDSGRED